MKKIILFILLGVFILALFTPHYGDTRGRPKPSVWRGQTAAPTTSDDSSKGYRIGDVWVDETNDNSYILQDTTQGSAVWTQIDDRTATVIDTTDESKWHTATLYSDKTTVANKTTGVSHYPNPTVGDATQLVTGVSIYMMGLSGNTENFTSTVIFHRSATLDGSDAWRSFNMQNVCTGVSIPGGQVDIGGVTIPLFTNAGLTEGDMLIVGAQDPTNYEIVQITDTVEDIDTGMAGVTVSPLTMAHSHDATVSLIYRDTDVWINRNSVAEIHISDEFLTAPNAGVSKYYEFEVL